MITVIKDYTLQDIEDSITYLLDKSSHDEGVRQHAINITSNNESKISAIFDWVRNNVQYVPDPVSNGDNVELFVSPVRMVKDYGEGKVLAEDCDGMAILSTAFCRAIGIRSDVIIVDQYGDGYDHAFCRAWSDRLGRYINVDPSSDYPLGWEISYKEKIIVGS